MLEQVSQGVILSVRARAGARRNEILGIRDGALRVAVTAPPEKGKANQAINALLSEALGVSKSAIELISGETAPQKRFLLRGADVKRVREWIQSILASRDQ
jgi:uncharacterized protein (TIGR00251 family)